MRGMQTGVQIAAQRCAVLLRCLQAAAISRCSFATIGGEKVVVQLLNIRDERARLREFGDFDETAAYLKHLKAHNKVTDDDIEYSTT